MHRLSARAGMRQESRCMDLFPVFLKMAARPCIVIGAGNLAESKIESLQAAHAKVKVIAPAARSAHR